MTETSHVNPRFHLVTIDFNQLTLALGNISGLVELVSDFIEERNPREHDLMPVFSGLAAISSEAQKISQYADREWGQQRAADQARQRASEAGTTEVRHD